MPELLTVKECAKLTRRSVEAFRKWAGRKRIRRVPNQGRKVLFFKTDILKLLEVENIPQLRSLGNSVQSAWGSDAPAIEKREHLALLNA